MTHEEDLLECETLEKMRIVKTGRGTYLAHSSSVPECAYAVDLHENNGLGSCECEDFLMRRKPQWREVQKNYDVFRCKHIRRIRNFVLDNIIAYYSK